MNDDKGRNETAEKPSPVQQVDDRGLATPEPASTTDKELDSALGGGTATRSGTEPAPNPAEQRSE